MNPVFSPSLLSMLKLPVLDLPRSQADDMPAVIDNQDRQLEGIWSGFQALKGPRRRAFGQLIAKIAKESEHEVRWNVLKGDNQIDPDGERLIEELASRHAYLATVTIALIARAKRASGILSSADFLWAREKDNGFWLLINGYGRARHAEAVATAFAHHALEVRLGEAIPETHSKTATIIRV